MTDADPLWDPEPAVILSSGPFSEIHGQLPDDLRTWPAGFTAPLKPTPETEPLLWAGDQA